jgi:hypothetical protein
MVKGPEQRGGGSSHIFFKLHQLQPPPEHGFHPVLPLVDFADAGPKEYLTELWRLVAQALRGQISSGAASAAARCLSSLGRWRALLPDTVAAILIDALQEAMKVAPDAASACPATGMFCFCQGML